MGLKLADPSAAATRRRIPAHAEPLVATVQTAAVMCDLSERQIKKLIAT